jgi:EAL domain-containing protein (putative c-di-GMP-specific phosphodiesterase class I)
MTGAEALLRWAQPTLGPISPGEFIPLAEQTALIGPLTDWVLESALAAAESFHRAGRDLKISVNASPANLAETNFSDKLLALCAQHQLAPEAMEIEFTEGALAGSGEGIERQLVRLRAAGIEVAIDDFGTGFSNFSRLASMPVDVLKIDQSFIRTLVPGDDFLVRHMLAMAKGMGFRVCAEGIETVASYDLLRTLGCDQGQGYFMARPMPAEALRDWRYVV